MTAVMVFGEFESKCLVTAARRFQCRVVVKAIEVRQSRLDCKIEGPGYCQVT